jgi:hypothetical protein
VVPAQADPASGPPEYDEHVSRLRSALPWPSFATLRVTAVKIARRRFGEWGLSVKMPSHLPRERTNALGRQLGEAAQRRVELSRNTRRTPTPDRHGQEW